MAEPPPFPWLYAYQEDGPRLDQVVQRPVVPIALVGGEVSDPVYALVDSGCSHVLAAPWMAASAGLDAKGSDRALDLGIGGTTVHVRFIDARVRLLAPGGAGDDQYVEWETEVGFVEHWRPTWPMIVGQTGFYDQFTVSMSRFAQFTAIDARETFDDRFGIPTAALQPDYPTRRARP